jgi:hypothetical protein
LPYVVVRFHEAFIREQGVQYADDQERLLGPFWSKLAEAHPGIRLRPLYRAVEPQKLEAFLDAIKFKDKKVFFTLFQVVGPMRTRFDEVARYLQGSRERVATAYVERPALPPSVGTGNQPRFAEQFHLRGALDGIGASAAWGQPGGDGAGVDVVDLERGWFLGHRDLPPVIELPGWINDFESQEHGAGVLGILCAKDDTFGDSIGGVGVAPRARVHVQSCVEGCDANNLAIINNQSAIEAATLHLHGRLQSGQSCAAVLLLEADIYDPAHPDEDDPAHYVRVPLEASFANLLAIEAAVAANIVVVEAGGNGDGWNMFFNSDQWTAPDSGTMRMARNLPSGAPNPDFRDSGAILVSASGLNWGAGIYPLAWAPRGSRVDCFAAGQNVVTCWTDGSPADDLYRPGPNGWDPEGFGGTSSAAAIVAGAAIALQGIACANGNRLTPAQMRQALSRGDLNTPAAPASGIGAMPDLARLVPELLAGNLHV